MNVNLAGLLRGAAACIPARRDTGAYAYSLREVADHVSAVREGRATVEDFTQLYLLPPTASRLK